MAAFEPDGLGVVGVREQDLLGERQGPPEPAAGDGSTRSGYRRYSDSTSSTGVVGSTCRLGHQRSRFEHGHARRLRPGAAAAPRAVTRGDSGRGRRRGPAPAG